MKPCPVCGSEDVEEFLVRRGVPVHQNRVMEDESAARSVPRGDLRMVVCRRCGFVFNRAFDLSLLSYDGAYDNSQAFSPAFETYLDGLVHRLVEEKGVRQARVVEIGCGKGLFLRKLVEAPGAGNVGSGFDPTYEGPAEDLGGRLRYFRRFYDDSCRDAADVIVCRHVIEHVPEPLPLLRAVRAALAASPGARLFFETPCVDWILEHRVVWDFFYEHCSLYSARSLSTAFQRAGFEVTDVQHVFGGQYLWLEAQLPRRSPTVQYRPGASPALARAFAGAERRLRGEWGERVRRLAGRGGVALWGAGAKGATLANLVDPGCELLTCIIDLNPRKQGRFLPGTGHPIVDYHQLPSLEVRTALLMNPNYRAENRELLQQAGVPVSLL